MKLFINEELQETPAYDNKSLREIILLIEKDRIPKSEVITTIKLNGVILSMEDEKNIAANYPVEKIESLELLSANPNDLMLEGLGDARDVLTNLVEHIAAVIDLLRQGDINKGSEKFQSCLGIMQWFNELLGYTTKFAKIDYSHITWQEDRSVAELNLKLLNIYGDITEAQRNNDWISLSDILEYEFIPVMQAWIKLLPVLLDYIKSKTGKAN